MTLPEKFQGVFLGPVHRRDLFGGVFGAEGLCGCESEPHTCTDDPDPDPDPNPRETMTNADTKQQIASDAFASFFRFELGDMVVPKELLAAYILDAEVNGAPGRLERAGVPYGGVVVERTLQQCHGGVQGFYRVRRVTKAGADGSVSDVLAQYVELELASWEEMVAACRANAPQPRKAAERSAWRDAEAAKDGALVPLSAPMPGSDE